MAVYTTPDGRVVIGTGVTDRNDYHGYNGKRDIVIQLTADGATTDGLNALEYLKSYAENAKAENKPIFPDGTRVFISANGYTKAVEADDVVIDGSNISIGGIVWNGSAWDYSNAGQTGGGVLLVNEVFDPQTKTISLDKTWQEIHDAAPLAYLVAPAPDVDDGASYYALTQIGKITGTGCIVTFEANYGCANPSDYPVYNWQP